MNTIGLHKQYINETLGENGLPERVTFNVPGDFNFAYDVIDRLGRETPDRRAMLWSNENGGEDN